MPVTVVFMDPHPEIYEWRPFDSDTIGGEIKQWLHENTTAHWSWQTEWHHGKFQICFRFSKLSDATLFKLVWGG